MFEIRLAHPIARVMIPVSLILGWIRTKGPLNSSFILVSEQ